MFVDIEVNVDTPRCKTFFSANTHHASITFDKRQLDQFSKVVHLGHQEFTKPGRNDAFAIKVIKLGGVHHDFSVWAIFRA